jgi:hypothetical protein
MAVESTAVSTGPLPANGVTTAFVFTFKALSESEVSAIAYDAGGIIASLPTYSVVLADNGGTVTFDTAPVNGLSVYLFSDPEFRQQIEFEQGSRWLAAPVNEANDRSALRDLWLRAKLALFNSAALFLPSARAGKFLSWDAGGNPVPSSGTGADAGLRTDLAAGNGSLVRVNDGAGGALFTSLAGFVAKLLSSAGASIVGWVTTGTGATARSVQATLRDLPLNPRDYGAIGDAFFHPLSERFGTLGAAQAVYPFVTSLTQSIDGVAIQAALNEAALDVNRRGTVRVPLGYFVLSESLQLPSHVTLEGVSQHGSVLFNQLTPLAAPMIVNKAPDALIYATIRNLNIYGGSYGVKIDVPPPNEGGEIAGLTIENVAFLLQSNKCFAVSQQLQTSRFINVTFDGNNTAANGFYSPAGSNNANLWMGCNFLNFVQASIFINAGSSNQLVGCRFEGGGLADDGKRTLQFNAMQSLTFLGCYFERTHEYLIESAAGGASTAFVLCEFIGPFDPSIGDDGDFVGYKFISETAITFISNDFFRATNAPANAITVGVNTNLTTAATSVASAATLSPPVGQSFVVVTGTTTITNVTIAPAGTRLTLGFAGACTVTDGGNLKINGDFVSTADDTLSLVSNGTSWLETSRSPN